MVPSGTISVEDFTLEELPISRQVRSEIVPDIVDPGASDRRTENYQ